MKTRLKTALLALIPAAVDQGVKLYVRGNYTVGDPELMKVADAWHLHPVYNESWAADWSAKEFATGIPSPVWTVIEVLSSLLVMAVIVYSLKCMYRASEKAGFTLWRVFTGAVAVLSAAIFICSLCDMLLWGRTLDYICRSYTTAGAYGQPVAAHVSFDLKDVMIYVAAVMFFTCVLKFACDLVRLAAKKHSDPEYYSEAKKRLREGRKYIFGL